MKKTKENLKNNNFTKLTRNGISLIVLVITIIVIIILAAAIIISLNNNNPIMEANKARYDSDVANMQAVFTNAVAKVMAKNQATLTISAGQINTITGGVAETTGEVAYTLTDAQNAANATGTIVFDKKDNKDTVFYTGKKLPIYAAGETKWYVDDDGNISLEVGGTKYGSANQENSNETKSMLVTGSTFNGFIPKNAASIIFTDETMPDGYTKSTTVTSNTYADLSEAQDESIISWMDSGIMYVSTQKKGVKISANPDCSNMFNRTLNAKTLKNIKVENLDTSNVTNMKDMFRNCTGIETLDLSSFDTSNVTDMSCMFYVCTNLTSLTISSFDTSKVEDMTLMFAICSSLPNLDISNFDSTNLKEAAAMFQQGKKLQTITLGEKFTLAKLENAEAMFNFCESLTSINLNYIDTSNVTTMMNMFANCTSLASIDVSNFDTKNVTNMAGMFNRCTNLSSVDVSNFDTKNVTYMSGMFEGCTNLNSIDVSNFDTKNVTNMSKMFNGCSSLTSLNVNNFDTSSVTSLSYMFDTCRSLTSLNLGSFDTSNVTDMASMFKECTNLKSVNVSSFNTAKVTDMSNMFKNCSSLTNLDLSTFDISNVYTDYDYKYTLGDIFMGCSSIVNGTAFARTQTEVDVFNKRLLASGITSWTFKIKS